MIIISANKKDKFLITDTMLKILNKEQIKECDAYTIQHEPVASIDLMERACRSFVQWLISRYNTDNSIGVVCGTGNNGGDGLAIARMLKEWGYEIKIWIVKGEVKETSDFAANFQRISKSGLEVFEISSDSDQGLFHGQDILIDTIFGSGLSRAADGIYAQAINCINKADAIRIAVDIPSGLFADKHSAGAIVKADHTVAFQLPKLAFLLPENWEYVGEWHLVDIRLSKKFIANAETQYFYLTPKDIQQKLKAKSKFDNKGTNGKALLVAGSYGKMGACILSARAALRSGVGLLTVHVPKAGYTIIQTAVPEGMAIVDVSEEIFTAAASEKFNVTGVGPGIGQDSRTVDGLKEIMAAGKPMVIDADALNILGANRELMKQIPAGSILTPHPKEFERLTGKWSDDFQRLSMQAALAKKIKAVIVLKGAHTSVALPDGNIFFNSTGNPGMAKGGTGDALTGVIMALLAQGYTADDAATVGVFIHGLAGDLASAEKGENSMIASDLIDFLPQAFKKIGGLTQ